MALRSSQGSLQEGGGRSDPRRQRADRAETRATSFERGARGRKPRNTSGHRKLKKGKETDSSRARRRNLTCQCLDFGFPPSRMVREYGCVALSHLSSWLRSHRKRIQPAGQQLLSQDFRLHKQVHGDSVWGYSVVSAGRQACDV